MTAAKKLIILGASGAGVEALWVARRINQAAGYFVWDVAGFADDAPGLHGREIDGVKVLGAGARVMRDFPAQETFFHCAIGKNRIRMRLALEWESAGFSAAALIDPSAIVAESASVGAGSFVSALSIVAPHAQVGRHVLINTHVGVGHHARVGDFAQLCPGVRLNGGCIVDSGAFLGSNASVHPGLSIGEGAIVGAGSFVIRSVKPRHSVLGVPARIVSRPAESGPDAQA